MPPVRKPRPAQQISSKADKSRNGIMSVLFRLVRSEKGGTGRGFYINLSELSFFFFFFKFDFSKECMSDKRRKENEEA